MKTVPKISIIVPVYRTEKYLCRCIESILNQTFTDFEVLLIDDGSPDNSGRICDEYAEKDERIRVIHKKNGGVNSARKKGICLAKGEYIALIDSDDSLPPPSLSSLYYKAKSLDLDIALGSSNDIYNGTERNNANLAEGIFDKAEYIKLLLVGKCIIGPACKIIRRSCIDMDIAFSLPKNIFLNEDLFMNISIGLMCEKVGIFNDIIAYNYTADNQNSISHSKTMTENEWIYLFEKIQERLNGVGNCFGICAPEYYAYIYNIIGSNFYNKNLPFNNLSFIRKTLCEDIYIHNGKTGIYKAICKYPFMLPIYTFIRSLAKKILRRNK